MERGRPIGDMLHSRFDLFQRVHRSLVGHGPTLDRPFHPSEVLLARNAIEDDESPARVRLSTDLASAFRAKTESVGSYRVSPLG